MISPSVVTDKAEPAANTANNRSRWKRHAIGAGFGLVCGVLFPILGGHLTEVVRAHWREHLFEFDLGIALLALTLPLLIFGIICLGRFVDDSTPSHEYAGPVRPPHNLPFSGGRPLLLVAGAMGSMFLFLAATTQAQQTIFNVPTTDVLDKGKVYAELDASLKPTDGPQVPRFSSFVPRIVVGAGSRVEIGLNITGNIQPGPDSTTLVPTIKWKAYQGKDNGWAFVVGDNLFVPIRNRVYDAGNYVYAEMSKTFKGGMRVTFGGYDFTRNVVAPANRAGGQFGFEQPLNKKVTLAADWFTGKHSAGFFTPGAVFKLGPKVTGYAGYSIGNQDASKGNHFFLLELGYNLN